MLSVALVSPERGVFLVWKDFYWLVTVRKSEEMWGRSCKWELPAAKPDIKDDGTESGRKYMLISVHYGEDGFGLG